MGLLCGHSGPVTLRAAHRALTHSPQGRVIARTPHDVVSSKKCIAFVIPPGGGDSAGPRTPTTPPPPPRGLRPTVSCQRYEPKEPTGAEGAPAPKAPNGVM